MNQSIEVFSAGCALCEDTIALVNQFAKPDHTITIHDMQDKDVAKRAKALNIGRVPAVVIDGKLADCCASAGPDINVLKEALSTSS